MDAVTYAILNKRIRNTTLAYDYKGSVESVEALPEDASLGDLYTVEGEQYVWDGEEWIIAGGKISNAQIDALFV